METVIESIIHYVLIEESLPSGEAMFDHFKAGFHRWNSQLSATVEKTQKVACYTIEVSLRYTQANNKRSVVNLDNGQKCNVDEGESYIRENFTLTPSSENGEAGRGDLKKAPAFQKMLAIMNDRDFVPSYLLIRVSADDAQQKAIAWRDWSYSKK
jgi:hypothetical protein